MAWGLESGGRRALGAALLLFAAFGLSGCAHPDTSYAGIPLAEGAADHELQSLARRAQTGDKFAQLDLGIRYEEGRGVPVDYCRAERLYKLAASKVSGPAWVYSPPAGAARGGVLNAGEERIRYGLAEAQERLDRLRCFGPVKPDTKC